MNAETINVVDTVQARHSASCMVMRGAIKIAVAEARIDDPSAMASFLAPIPNNGELAALLAKKELLNTRAYDDETQTARFRCGAIAGLQSHRSPRTAVSVDDMDAFLSRLHAKAVAILTRDDSDPNGP